MKNNKIKFTIAVLLGIGLSFTSMFAYNKYKEWQGTHVNDESMNYIEDLDKSFEDIVDENLRLLESSTSDHTVINNYKEQVRQIREYELLIHGRDERIVILQEEVLIRDNQIKDLSERLTDLQGQLDIAYDEAVVINSKLAEMVEKYVGE